MFGAVALFLAGYVLPVALLFGVRPDVLGLIDLRGTVVPVVDLADFIGMSPETPLGLAGISWAGFPTRGTSHATGPTLASERLGNTRDLKRLDCRAVIRRAGERP